MTQEKTASIIRTLGEALIQIASVMEQIEKPVLTSEEERAKKMSDLQIRFICSYKILSSRTLMICEKILGAETIFDLACMRRSSVMSMKGIGKKTFDELTALLRCHGTFWGEFNKDEAIG